MHSSSCPAAANHTDGIHREALIDGTGGFPMSPLSIAARWPFASWADDPNSHCPQTPIPSTAVVKGMKMNRATRGFLPEACIAES